MNEKEEEKKKRKKKKKKKKKGEKKKKGAYTHEVDLARLRPTCQCQIDGRTKLSA